MERFLWEIKKALDNQLYLVALQSCLTIPDICGVMESDNGNSTRDKYVNWYDQYAAAKMNCKLLALDCYYFRCSMLHQGTTIPNPKKNDTPSFNRIVFIAPDDKHFFFHNNTMNGALNIDLHIFCNGMIEAAAEWLRDMEKKQTPNYKKNTVKLIRYYPEGLPPYTSGIGTIG